MEKIIGILLLAAAAQAYSPEEELLYGSFPNDFVWGAATAAYQVIGSLEHVKMFIDYSICTDRGRLG